MAFTEFQLSKEEPNKGSQGKWIGLSREEDTAPYSLPALSGQLHSIWAQGKGTTRPDAIALFLHKTRRHRP
jgi:hypothetical protein